MIFFHNYFSCDRDLFYRLEEIKIVDAIIPNTNARVVVNIDNAVSIPAIIWLFIRCVILKNPREPGTKMINPGINITAEFFLKILVKPLLTIPNPNDAINTAIGALT